MAHQYLATNAEPKPNVLESLADGMSHVIARPWLIGIPLLLDVALLLVPRLSGGAFGQSLGRRFADQEQTALNQFGTWLTRQGDWSIERATALLVPSVIDGVATGDRYSPYTPSVLHANAAVGAILLAIAVFLGALLFMAFETWIATETGIRDQSESSLLRAIIRGWLSYLGFIAMMAIALSLVAGAILAPALVTGKSGPDGDSIITITSLVGLAVLLGTMFVPEAIVLDRTGPIGSIRRSVHVVATNFWQAMAFFLVSLLIAPGLLAIWETIAFDPLGLAVAIVLNAGMVTSLAIASLGFYRARTTDAPAV